MEQLIANAVRTGREAESADEPVEALIHTQGVLRPLLTDRGAERLIDLALHSDRDQSVLSAEQGEKVSLAGALPTRQVDLPLWEGEHETGVIKARVVRGREDRRHLRGKRRVSRLSGLRERHRRIADRPVEVRLGQQPPPSLRRFGGHNDPLHDPSERWVSRQASPTAKSGVAGA